MASITNSPSCSPFMRTSIILPALSPLQRGPAPVPNKCFLPAWGASGESTCSTAAACSDSENEVENEVRKDICPADVEWLLGSLNLEQKTNFDRSMFHRECQRVFRMMDKDESGFLDQSELEDVIAHLIPGTHKSLNSQAGCHLMKSIQSVLAAFDKDSNCQLSSDEFPDFVRFCYAWRSQQEPEVASPQSSSGSVSRRLRRSASCASTSDSVSRPDCRKTTSDSTSTWASSEFAPAGTDYRTLQQSNDDRLDVAADEVSALRERLHAMEFKLSSMADRNSSPENLMPVGAAHSLLRRTGSNGFMLPTPGAPAARVLTRSASIPNIRSAPTSRRPSVSLAPGSAARPSTPQSVSKPEEAMFRSASSPGIRSEPSSRRPSKSMASPGDVSTRPPTPPLKPLKAVSQNAPNRPSTPELLPPSLQPSLKTIVSGHVMSASAFSPRSDSSTRPSTRPSSPMSRSASKTSSQSGSAKSTPRPASSASSSRRGSKSKPSRSSFSSRRQSPAPTSTTKPVAQREGLEMRQLSALKALLEDLVLSVRTLPELIEVLLHRNIAPDGSPLFETETWEQVCEIITHSSDDEAAAIACFLEELGHMAGDPRKAKESEDTDPATVVNQTLEVVTLLSLRWFSMKHHMTVPHISDYQRQKWIAPAFSHLVGQILWRHRTNSVLQSGHMSVIENLRWIAATPGVEEDMIDQCNMVFKILSGSAIGNMRITQWRKVMELIAKNPDLRQRARRCDAVRACYSDIINHEGGGMSRKQFKLMLAKTADLMSVHPVVLFQELASHVEDLQATVDKKQTKNDGEGLEAETWTCCRRV